MSLGVIAGCNQFERTNPADPGGENFQPATIKGTVISTTGISLNGAEVSISISDGEDISARVSTDEEGRYIIPNVLPEKTYTVTASKVEEYSTESKKVLAKTGEVSIVDFELRDIEKPTIVHEPVSGRNSGDEIAIIVNATDNESVLEVKIFYRIATEESFIDSLLEETSDDTYTGVIPSDVVVAAGVHYYIYVEDFNGNTATSGSNNEPHLINVTPSSTSIPIPLPSPTPSSTPDPVSPTNSTVVASPITVNADGLSLSSVTVTLKDTGDDPLNGHSIVVSSGDHPTTITPSSGTTNSSGQTVFVIKSTQEGVATITATDTTDNVIISNTATIAFTDVAPPGSITGFTVAPGSTNGEITGSWTNPSEGDLEGVKFIYRTDGVFPTSVTDGTELSDEPATPSASGNTTWSGLNPEATYHITGFAYDEVPSYSPGTSANIGIKPRDLTSPAAVASFIAIGGRKQVFLKWMNPSDSDFAGVKILRKEGGYPTDPDDSGASEVYDNTGLSYTDIGLTDGISYYYRAYAHDEVANFSPDAQANVTLESWDKMIGSGAASSVAVDSTDGSVYVVGRGINLVMGSSSGDWWIKKYSSSGGEIWERKFDAGSNDGANSVAVNQSDGSVYVAGYGFDLISGTSQADWWIKKFDSSGVEDTTNWDKQIDFGNQNSESANSVAIDPADGSVYVAGYGRDLVGSSGQDWWIKKFTPSGTEDTTFWDMKINSSGSQQDSSESVAIDPADGSVYVAGFGSNLVSGSSGQDWWIKKFDSGGNEDTLGWNKKYDASDSDELNSVAVASDGSVYAVGSFDSDPVNGDSDWWIKKFDSSGNEDTVGWDKKLDASDSDELNSVAVASDGSVYVVGADDTGWWIKKFSSDGVEK